MRASRRPRSRTGSARAARTSCRDPARAPRGRGPADGRPRSWGSAEREAARGTSIRRAARLAATSPLVGFPRSAGSRPAAFLMEIEGRRFLVTGGSGFVGSHVVDALVAAGAGEVVVFDQRVVRRESRPAASRAGRVRVVEGDVRDAASVGAATRGVDGVFHLAVLPLGPCVEDPRLCLDVNVVGTFNVAEAAQQAGVQEDRLLVRFVGLRGHRRDDGRVAPLGRADDVRRVEDRRRVLPPRLRRAPASTTLCCGT